MRQQNAREEGEGIRRRVEELSGAYGGKGKKSRLRLNLMTLVPIVLVFIIVFLFKQGF